MLMFRLIFSPQRTKTAITGIQSFFVVINPVDKKRCYLWRTFEFIKMVSTQAATPGHMLSLPELANHDGAEKHQ